MTHKLNPKMLVQLRERQYWTQEDLSAASGVSVRTIQRIERDGGGSLESRKALAAAFDMRVDELQNLPVKPSYSTSQKRNAMIGFILSVVGATIGNSFAWGAMGSHLSEQLPALRPHPLLLVIFGLGLAFCYFPPVLIWQKYLRSFV